MCKDAWDTVWYVCFRADYKAKLSNEKDLEEKGCRIEHESESVNSSVVYDSAIPWIVAHQALCPWDSPGKNTGVGGHSIMMKLSFWKVIR